MLAAHIAQSLLDRFGPAVTSVLDAKHPRIRWARITSAPASITGFPAAWNWTGSSSRIIRRRREVGGPFARRAPTPALPRITGGGGDPRSASSRAALRAFQRRRPKIVPAL